MNNTIAAIATAPGPAAISIVRLSGPEAVSIIDKIITCSGPKPSDRPTASLVYGHIKSGQAFIDEVIVLIMRAPHSYTREDVIEIQTHGGAVSARRVLRCVLKQGARPADPGEFTKRAFLNGRIDLLQAEAVCDLINALSDRSAQSAVEQLRGGISIECQALYDGLLRISSNLECSLDFSEEDTQLEIMSDALDALRPLEARISRMLEIWGEGHLLRDGALVVLSGKTNVGKSTLLNTLLRRDRAIVSSTPGTTRDTIEEYFLLSGIPLRLVDTAGIRETSSAIEGDGVARALKQIESADIRIHMIDSSARLQADDVKQFGTMNPRKTIVALNKQDLGQEVYPQHCRPICACPISCRTGYGIEDLKKLMLEMIGVTGSREPHATISERHRNILLAARRDIQMAIETLDSAGEEAIVVVASLLRSSAQAIGGMLGRAYTDDILDEIFGRFCIGK